MTSYLIYKDKWELTTLNKATKHLRKNGIGKTLEVKDDELIIIFHKDIMQVFTAEKEMQRLYLKDNEKKYNFAGKIVGKYESDIFVYKRK